MKKIIFTYTIMFFIYGVTVAQGGGNEFFIQSFSSTGVVVKVYPNSMIFNNDTASGYGNRNYNLVARERGYLPRRDFVNGMNKDDYHSEWGLNTNDIISWDFDHVPGYPNGSRGNMGFGIWRFDFYWTPGKIPEVDPPDDFFTLEIDLGYRFRTNFAPPGCDEGDLWIEFRNPDENGRRIFWRWKSCECNGYITWHSLPIDRKLFERDRGCPNQFWGANYGNFKYNSGRFPEAPNPYTIIPQDPEV